MTMKRGKACVSKLAKEPIDAIGFCPTRATTILERRIDWGQRLRGPHWKPDRGNIHDWS